MTTNGRYRATDSFVILQSDNGGPVVILRVDSIAPLLLSQETFVGTWEEACKRISPGEPCDSRDPVRDLSCKGEEGK